MPAPTLPASLGYPRLLSAADGGTDLTTTPVFIAVPQEVTNVILITRNFESGVANVATISLNPWITVISTLDGMATSPSVQSAAAQDGVAGTVVTLSNLPTLANGGAVYIGANKPFSALQADVVAPNGGGGTMAVTYWNGTAWTTITPTDNTANFANDGSITWTVPTDWVKANLQTAIAYGAPRVGLTNTAFWVRIATSAVYDASVTLASLYALGQYGHSGGLEAPEGYVFQEQTADVGNISASTDAGTANLIVNGFVN